MTDQSIIDGIQAGGTQENRAIEMLYNQNSGSLKAFLRSMNSNDSAKEPEDILWEGVEALVNNIKSGKYQIQKGIKLSAYLKSILKNLWLKHLNSEKARTGRQHSYFEQSDNMEVDVSELMAEKETWDSYLAIFEKVGKNCKRILQMVFGLGYSIKDLSKVLIDEGLYSNEQVIRNAKSKCLKKVTEQLVHKRD